MGKHQGEKIQVEKEKGQGKIYIWINSLILFLQFTSIFIWTKTLKIKFVSLDEKPNQILDKSEKNLY